ncbi:MAG: hypothetical protein WCO69_07005 [Candidatus Omnitrophota bacterium]
MADKRPWYFRDGVVVVAVLSFLVLALPLVWLSPHYTTRRKVIVSVLVVIGTYLTWQGTVAAIKTLQTAMSGMM